MISEIKTSEPTEVAETKVEIFHDAKAKSEMTFREAESFWKSEFHDQAEQAKGEAQDKSEISSEDNKQEIPKQDISELAKDYIDDL